MTSFKALNHLCFCRGVCWSSCWPESAGWTHHLCCTLHAEQDAKGKVQKHSKTHINSNIRKHTEMSHMNSENTNLFCLVRPRSQETILPNEEPIAQNSVFDFYDGKIDVSKMTFVCSLIKFML